MGIQRLGIYCKKQLNFIQQLGERLYPPSETEIMWLKQVKFLHPNNYLMIVPIWILLMDKTVKTFNVCSYTSVKDVECMLNEKCALKMPQIFSLYELDLVTGEQKLLKKNDRILDVLGSWEKYSYGSKKWRNTNRGDPKNKRLLYKVRLVTHTSYKAVVDDPVTANLLYFQAVYNVAVSNYRIEKEDFPILASDQLMVSHCQRLSMSKYNELKRDENKEQDDDKIKSISNKLLQESIKLSMPGQSTNNYFNRNKKKWWINKKEKKWWINKKDAKNIILRSCEMYENKRRQIFSLTQKEWEEEEKKRKLEFLDHLQLKYKLYGTKF